MKWFSNLKIGKKLAVGFSIVVLIIVILSTIVFVNFSSYMTANNWNVHTHEVLQNFEKIVQSMVNMETGQRGFSITGDDNFLEPYNNGKSDFDKYFNDVKALTSDNPEQQANLDKIKQLKEDWQKVAENSINLRREVENKSKDMEDVIREESAAKGKAYMDELRSVISESTNIENTLLQQRDSSQKSLGDLTRVVLIVGTLSATILALLLGIIVSRTISKPIKATAECAKELASGNLDAPLNVKSKDEAGQLAATINGEVRQAFKDIEQARIKTEKQAQYQSVEVRKLLVNLERLSRGELLCDIVVDKADQDTEALQQLYSEIASNLQSGVNAIKDYISEISDVLSEMANGNMCVGISSSYKGDFIALKQSINMIIESLNNTLMEINSAAVQVASGTAQVSSGSQTISEGATEQASSIEELSASITQIAAQTNLNATNANKANELALNAQSEAALGNGHMREMQEAMTQINESSENISKIIKVIDDIAFQTNILALNAAVEAARAGVHGKGFAVVAEEVRNLAARSANAAKETTELIEGSIKKAEAGTKIANQTAAALSSIVTGVENAAQLVGQIAAASNEQATGISQVNRGIEQLSQVVQTNSATAEEAAAASEELSSQADLLKTMIAQFKLRDTQDKRLDESKKARALNDGNKSVEIKLDDQDFGKY